MRMTCATDGNASFVGSVDRLWPEVAYEMADAFFAIAYEPTRQRSTGGQTQETN